MTLITLEQWNDSVFGGRYTSNTLRAWARNGYITPQPIKVGRDWLVDQSAQYQKPKNSTDIPSSVDISIKPTDPRVLAILNDSKYRRKR